MAGCPRLDGHEGVAALRGGRDRVPHRVREDRRGRDDAPLQLPRRRENARGEAGHNGRVEAVLWPHAGERAIRYCLWQQQRGNDDGGLLARWPKGQGVQCERLARTPSVLTMMSRYACCSVYLRIHGIRPQINVRTDRANCGSAPRIVRGAIASMLCNVHAGGATSTKARISRGCKSATFSASAIF